VRFEPDENCWRVNHTDRLAFLVDGAAYFAALRQAAIRARHSIAMIGWDFDTQVRLSPEGAPSDGFPATLLAFLNALCKRTPSLSIYVLAWDFSVIYTFEREPLPAMKFAWRSHRRVHFALDGEHAVGASHHQKVIVVDDRVAFAGDFLEPVDDRHDRAEHEGEVGTAAQANQLAGGLDVSVHITGLYDHTGGVERPSLRALGRELATMAGVIRLLAIP